MRQWMFLDLHALRFSFRAAKPIHFPAGSPGNLLRGNFGHLLRKLSCRSECPGAKLCPHRTECAYSRVFEPAALDGGPSGLANPPRPFVFRAAHLGGTTVRPGESFEFGLNLFELSSSVQSQCVGALSQLAWARLERVITTPIRLDLSARPQEAARVRVQFITPTGLKAGNQAVIRPDFAILFARIRDRVSTLRALYGPGRLEIDFKDLGARAAEIRLRSSGVSVVAASRRSSRTGQVHDVGGFVGWAEYEGALGPFVPYLEAAKWTGVGRHCVWGNGEIESTRLAGGVADPAVPGGGQDSNLIGP